MYVMILSSQLWTNFSFLFCSRAWCCHVVVSWAQILWEKKDWAIKGIIFWAMNPGANYVSEIVFSKFIVWSLSFMFL